MVKLLPTEVAECAQKLPGINYILSKSAETAQTVVKYMKGIILMLYIYLWLVVGLPTRLGLLFGVGMLWNY
jgi:hypothetical protein